MHTPPKIPGVIGGLFFVIWFLMVIGGMVSWIFFLVAAWRTMKAHESIAGTVREIAHNLKSK